MNRGAPHQSRGAPRFFPPASMDPAGAHTPASTMRKISSSPGRRGLDWLKLAGAGLRVAKADQASVEGNARRFLSLSMGRMKGLPQKLGQILSMADGEDAEPYEGLAEASEPLPFPVIEQVLAHEWRRPWREVLSDLEPDGRAASLGQVHRGILREGGAQVAVKVQYPGIAKAVGTDLKLLGWLSIPLKGFRRQFNLKAYRDELLRDLKEELDYRLEAENQHQYHFLSGYAPGLVVPAVQGGLTTPRVLVTEWEEGETLEEVAAGWDEDGRKAAARLFVEHALGFFRQGFVHADLHPGNFRFRRGAGGKVELVLYDFGCVFRGELEVRLALLRLIAITGENAADDPYPLFLKLGFNPDYLDPMAERLPALCRVLFEPFLINAPYDVSRWRLGERVADVLGDDRWNFRIAGPAQLIFLMRMFHGLIHTLSTLNAPVNWKFLLEPIGKQFAAQVADLPLEAPPRAGRGFSGVANHLRIQVIRDGETKVKLTSPLQAIDHLDEMMGEDLQRQIEAQQVDLKELVHQVRRNGYRPQEVFCLKTGDKEVRVWLE